MFMRFRGGGIGHKSTQEQTRVFAEQSHVLRREDDDELSVVDGGDSEEEIEEGSEVEEDTDEVIEVEDEELSGGEGGNEMGGGEDGEEPWDEDEFEAEGYAQL
jgi:hypothetical protein